MAAHLWTKAPPPPAYEDLRLCRDIYHCPPSVLDEQDAERILAHIACINQEAAMPPLEAQRKSKGNRGRR